MPTPSADQAHSHGSEQPETPEPRGLSHAVVAIAFVVVLLALVTMSQGGFAINRWAPLALFALAALIGSFAGRRGGSRPVPGAVRVALAGIWGLAGWSLLSMVWAQSSGDAFEAGDRVILYAAIATLPFALPLSRRTLAAAGWAITAAVGAIAVYVLVRLLVNGAPLFLAGRLNGPVNYRNATALLFALPVWPCVIAAAARGYGRVVRAGALSLATLCLGLAFLTQSRGIVLGLIAGGCVALAFGPDRVRRTWCGGLALGGVALGSPWLLRPFHAFDGGNGTVAPHEITVAAWALLGMSAIAFIVGLMIAIVDNGLRTGSMPRRYVRRAARLGLAGAIVALCVVSAVAVRNPVTYAHQKWDEFRSLQSSTPTTTRLLTVGGQRYDLWRVAFKEFESAPLIGVGAENYAFGYYRDRATNRNLDDPHSLVFALLSEVGAVGLALFCLFLGGIAAVLRGRWGAMAPSARRHAIAPAAAGAVLLGQITVDWIWLIPGLMAIGIFALSVAAAQAVASDDAKAGTRAPGATRQASGGHGARRGRAAVRLGTGVALLAAVVGVLALLLSDGFIQRARSDAGDPHAELSAARTASILDPWSVTPHYLESSAYESEGDRAQAHGQLDAALALEPRNSATLGVLGDFEVRGGSLRAARADYRRALALNPLDTGLQQLVRIGESSRRHARRRRP